MVATQTEKRPKAEQNGKSGSPPQPPTLAATGSSEPPDEPVKAVSSKAKFEAMLFRVMADAIAPVLKQFGEALPEFNAGLNAIHGNQVKIANELAALRQSVNQFERERSDYDRNLAGLFLKLRPLRGPVTERIAVELGAQLYNAGIDEFSPKVGDPFSGGEHTADGTHFVSTCDESSHNTICRTVQPGMKRISDGNVLIRARVVLFRFDAARAASKQKKS